MNESARERRGKNRRARIAMIDDDHARLFDLGVVGAFTVHRLTGYDPQLPPAAPRGFSSEHCLQTAVSTIVSILAPFFVVVPDDRHALRTPQRRMHTND